MSEDIASAGSEAERPKGGHPLAQNRKSMTRRTDKRTTRLPVPAGELPQFTPIPHSRYATDEAWLVVRGKRDGNSNDEMRKVFNALIASLDFAGRQASSADEFIFAAARDTTRGCGNSTIWRQLNTTRHITQAVTDIAKVRGIDIQPLPVPKEEIQVPMF
jgi:hypothetical protein